MSSRPLCQFPNDCQARGYGAHCRHCCASAQMLARNADPVFRAANAVRGAEQIRKFNAGCDLKARAKAQSRALMQRLGVPVGAEDVYRLARIYHFTPEEAAEMARRESARRERVSGPT